jgi:hypothetical protein
VEGSEGGLPQELILMNLVLEISACLEAIVLLVWLQGRRMCYNHVDHHSRAKMRHCRYGMGLGAAPCLAVLAALLASCALNFDIDGRDAWPDRDEPVETADTTDATDTADTPSDRDGLDPAEAGDDLPDGREDLPDGGDDQAEAPPDIADVPEDEPDNPPGCGNGVVEPPEECDGEPPGSCTTVCGTTGTSLCTACRWVCTPPADDDCDGIDDDCSGTPDDACVCTAPAPCGGSTNVRAGAATGGRFSGATSGVGLFSGSCADAGGPEALYHFTLDTVSDVFLTTHGSGFDTVLYVRGCGCGGAEVACNDDADGRTTSAISLTDLPPGTYGAFVDGKGSGGAGSYIFDVYITAPGEEGDRCGDPVYLTPGMFHYTSPDTTCNLTDDTRPITVGGCSGPGVGVGEDLVLYFVVDADGTTVSFDTCATTADFDTVIYIRSICNDGGVSSQRACNDDGASCSVDIYSSLTVVLGRGVYYLVADAWGAECGPFQLYADLP